MEERIFGESAPDAGVHLGRGHAVDEPLFADGVPAADAVLADAAGSEQLDRGPVARLDASAVVGVRVYPTDAHDRFVTDDDRVVEYRLVVEHADVLSVIRAADTTALDTGEDFAVSDNFGDWQFLDRHVPCGPLDRGASLHAATSARPAPRRRI